MSSNIEIPSARLASFLWFFMATFLISACAAETRSPISLVSSVTPVQSSSAPSTQTPMVSITPASTPTAAFTTYEDIVKIRVTYWNFEYGQAGLEAYQIWTFASLDQTPKVLLETGPAFEGKFWPPPYWSPDGCQAAFLQPNTSEAWVAVSTHNICTGETIQVVDPISADWLHSDFLMSWSLNARWLYFEITDEFFYTFGNIWNVETKEIYFASKNYSWMLGWSPANEDEYLYVSLNDYPEITDNRICSGKVGSDTQNQCIFLQDRVPLYGNYFSISPDGNRALFISPKTSQASPQDYLIVDFQRSEVQEIQLEQYKLHPYWSLHSHWIAMYDAIRGLQLLNADTLETIPVIKASSQPLFSLLPLGWLQGVTGQHGDILIYQLEKKVYAFDPEQPGKSILIYDFSAGLDGIEAGNFQFTLIKEP
jgi:hypothetical protein